MTRVRVLAATAAFCLMTVPAGAVDVFQWTDDEGVVHFSDEQPTVAVEQVTHFVIAPSNPLDYDPADDEYSIRNQAARINEYYQKIEERREERAKKRNEAAAMTQAPPQFTRIYDEPVRSYFVPLHRPVYPPITPYKKHRYPHPHSARPRPFEEPRRYRQPSVSGRPPPGRVAPAPVTPQAIPSQPVRWAPSRHPR